MKEVTKLLIEANIIPESVVNLCRIWNGDIGELPEAAKQKTQAELLAVVRKVAELMEEDALPEIKEAALDLDATFQKTTVKGVITAATRSGLEAQLTLMVGFDLTGNMLIKAEKGEVIDTDKLVRVGNIVILPANRMVRITAVEPRYTMDKISFFVCSVEDL